MHQLFMDLIASNRKFDATMFDSLQTKTTNERQQSKYTLTLYAGWEANTYSVTYEENDVNSTNSLKNYTVKTNSLANSGTGGSSPSYFVSSDQNLRYTLQLTFDAEPVDAKAFQRIGYTFLGFSFG